MKKAVFAAALGLVLTCIGAPSLFDSLALRRSRSFADAELVDSRIMVTKGRMTHEVRYRFSVPRLSGSVTRTDFLGRSDLWSTLPENDWIAAKQSGHLKVQYDPRRVTNNAPTAGLPQIDDDLTAVGLGVALLVLASVAYLRAKEHTDDLQVDQKKA